jgi:hypothetical protein
LLRYGTLMFDVNLATLKVTDGDPDHDPGVQASVTAALVRNDLPVVSRTWALSLNQIASKNV